MVTSSSNWRPRECEGAPWIIERGGGPSDQALRVIGKFLDVTALGALADGLVDPFSAAALQRREDEAGVRAAVADVVARELLVLGQVDHAAESVLDLVEGLAPYVGDGEDQRSDVRRQAGEIDRNEFVGGGTYYGKGETAVKE